jgi:eukaryotic translation initiation factor 2C
LPDPKITKLENDRLAVTKGNTFEGLPGRKSYGDTGKAVVLRVNYFQLQLAHDVGKKVLDRVLHRYTVAWADEKMPKLKKRRAMEQVLALPEFKSLTHASDYGVNIVTAEKVSEKLLNQELKVVLPPKGSSAVLAAPDDGASEHVKAAAARNTIEFKINAPATLNVRDLVAYIESTSREGHYAGYGDLMQMLNIIMCKAPNEAASVAKLPGNKFYPHQGLLGANNHPDVDFEELAGGLVALRGYFSSVRCATGRMLLNLNVTSGAFYQTVPLMELLARFGNPDPEQREIFIRRLKVLYQRPGKNPVKSERTIVGFARPVGGKKPVNVKRFSNAREVKFTYTDRSGTSTKEITTSVFDFFKGLGITLASPELPVLNVGAVGDPIYIPIEMCTVLPGQPYRKFLSGDQTTQMLKFAARVPNQNAMSIAGDGNIGGTGLKLLQLSGRQGAGQSIELFGLSANTKMLTVHGRILMPPTVQYGKKRVAKPFNGSWNCADQAFVRGGKFDGWTSCILDLPGRTAVPYDEPNGHTSTDLTNALRQELVKYGLVMGEYKGARKFTLSHLGMANRDANNKVLDGIFSKLEANRIPLVFIVLPNDDKWLYARIKYYGDTRYGIHTICAIGNKLAKPKGQGMFFGNLALKFNLKGGGVNHEIAGTLANPLDAHTMLMGIDVTHPSPGSAKGAPSIATAVASRDRWLSQWPGSLRKQKGKQEMIDEGNAQYGDCVNQSILKEMVKERLEVWRKANDGQLPKKILLYRDGVSEGQYKLVLDQELPHFEAAFLELYGAKPKWPKMAVIVVGKRHHTRFYPTSEEEADYNSQKQMGSLNTKPGTVVDRGITGTTYHEFYLQAHQGLQGTVRPGHYVVIKDDIGFNANSLEQITHSLCYLFGRAPKAVSYVPPAYYADILATRGRAYLYNTLQENHGADSTTGSGSLGDSEWDGKIHPRLKDSMFYI